MSELELLQSLESIDGGRQYCRKSGEVHRVLEDAFMKLPGRWGIDQLTKIAGLTGLTCKQVAKWNWDKRVLPLKKHLWDFSLNFYRYTDRPNLQKLKFIQLN